MFAIRYLNKILNLITYCPEILDTVFLCPEYTVTVQNITESHLSYNERGKSQIKWERQLTEANTEVTQILKLSEEFYSSYHKNASTGNYEHVWSK